MGCQNAGILAGINDVPESSWGSIIGKKGAMKQKLQTTFGVTITVPRMEGAHQKVKLRGTPDACAACEDADDLVFVFELAAACLPVTE